LQSAAEESFVAVEIVMPHLSDSMEEGTVVQWLVAEGDEVKEGDPLVEVETDKATVVYEAEVSGTVLRLHAAEDANIAVGTVIATIGGPGEDISGLTATAPTASAVAVASAPASIPAAALKAPTSDGRVKASPLARRVAIALGVDLGSLVGSGPHGRVIRADVERSNADDRSVHLAAGAAAAGGSPQAGGGKGAVTRLVLSRLQRTIARRMVESRTTVPEFELRREIDMGAVVALREQLREFADPLPSYNDFMVKAAALALREFPRVNGTFTQDAFETHSRVNIGFAVAAEDALIVPTIFDADRRSLIEIGEVARELAAKVRDGSVSPAELDGATFSISNLGMLGLDSFSAVINPPQAAILAIGSLKPRPVVAQDGVSLVARPTVNVSLACDHRILYGADGARFLQRLTELLEQPLSLLV
jgi:pyruvate dehydrogenase E2 component (dihydrolipoamide acetyltransferase)